MVEHQSAESEGLRFDSSWELRVFSFSHAREKMKNIFLLAMVTKMIPTWSTVLQDHSYLDGSTEGILYMGQRMRRTPFGFVLQECLELQLYWICHLQNLLKCEHNLQVMCEAGLPQQILDRCEAALVTEEHPLHAPLQRMFERLASQSLTPTVLR